MLVQVIQILIKQRVSFQVVRLFLGTFDKSVLLQLNFISELILSSEVELKVDANLLVLSVDFKPMSNLFEVFLKVEGVIFLYKGAILKGWPILHVLKSQDDLMTSHDYAH